MAERRGAAAGTALAAMAGALLVAACAAPTVAGTVARSGAGDGSGDGSGGHAVLLLVTGSAEEPAPALSSAERTRLRAQAQTWPDAVAVIVTPQGRLESLPLTPHRANGDVEHGPRRDAVITANLAAVDERLAAVTTTEPGFDLLGELAAAARQWHRPAELDVLSSGLSTRGIFALQRAGWSADPADVVRYVVDHQAMPDLTGWTVHLSRLGAVAGRQPALPEPTLRRLTGYWSALCAATGATCDVRFDPGATQNPSRSTAPGPIVPVDLVPPFTGPPASATREVAVDAALFDVDSARLLPGAQALLGPLAARIRAGDYRVRIVGHTDDAPGRSAAHDRALSLNRARAVADALIGLGVPAASIVDLQGVGSLGVPALPPGARYDPFASARWRRVVVQLVPRAPEGASS